MESQPAVVTLAKWKSFHSPLILLINKKTIPAASICHVVLARGEPTELYFEKREPPAQLIEPISMMPRPVNSAEAFPAKRSLIWWLNKKTTPINPISSPRIIFLLERSVFHFGLSNKTNQSGADEIKIAA